MEWVALVVVAGALLVGLMIGAWLTRSRVGVSGRQRRQAVAERRHALDGAKSSDNAPKGPGDDVEVTTVIVPIDDADFPDVYLALGSTRELEVLDSAGAWSTMSTGVAVGNLVGQAIQGYAEAATLVRLSPETVGLLKSGAQVVKGPAGFNLGVLRDPASRRFVRQVKWAKAGSVASTVSALGNALSMAMIQLQLNAITGQLDAVATQLDRVSASLQFAVEADLRASVKAVEDARRLAEISGMVTDRQLLPIQGESRTLDAHIRRLESECRAALRRLISPDPPMGDGLRA